MLVPNSLLEIGGLHPRQHWGGGLQSRASTSSCQANAEHFEQCAEFPTLRIQNRFPSHASTEGREVKAITTP
jgi:hypothetical protein